MSVSKKFEAACMDLREGRIDFTAFRVATHRNWASLARYILRRWRCPPAVCEEDVAQELLLAAWELVPKWDPARENAWPIGRFLVWRACNSAKAFVHRQRGASHTGSVDRQPGRFALTFSSLAREDEDEVDSRISGSVPASQHDDLEARTDQMVLFEGLSREDQVALAALISKGGVPGPAAAAMYDHPEARRIARLGSREQARRKIARAQEMLLAAAS